MTAALGRGRGGTLAGLAARVLRSWRRLASEAEAHRTVLCRLGLRTCRACRERERSERLAGRGSA